MADTGFETRVYIRKQGLLSESRVRPEAAAEIIGALAAIFLPVVIGKLIGGIAAALKKAGGEKTRRDSGRLPTYLYQIANAAGAQMELNPNLGCVIIVRGRFSSADDAAIPPLQFTTPGIFLSSDEEDEERRILRLNDNGIPVVEIGAVYEAQVVVSDDETALRYKSRFLQINQFQDSGSKRAMVVSIAVSGAGEKEGEPVLSLALMNFGELSEGTILGPNDLRGRSGAWLGGLGISDTSMNAVKAMKLPDARKPNPIGIMPVTIEGVFAETKEANAALLFIAEVLDATKDKVAETISGQILKDPAKAAAEAADAIEKLRQEEESAYAAFLTAQGELAKLGPPPAQPTEPQLLERRAKEFEVERTRRAWRLKFDALQKFGVSLTRAE